jgi:hypothetical protein
VHGVTWVQINAQHLVQQHPGRCVLVAVRLSQQRQLLQVDLVALRNVQRFQLRFEHVHHLRRVDSKGIATM